MDSESEKLTSFPFKHCFNLITGEIDAIALTRGITAAVCAVASFTVLAILVLVNCYRHRMCETVVKRLVAGYTAVNVPYQLVLSVHLIHYYVQPEQEYFCKANGFLNQYLESVEFLFMLAISLVLFLKLCEVTTSWKCHYSKATFTCCGRKINKLETVLFASLFCFPLLFDWIPFSTDSYGAFGAWCWIRKFENNCSIHQDGLNEQIAVANVPLGFILVVTLEIFIESLFLLGYAFKNSEKPNKVRITKSVFFLIAFMLVLYVVEMASYFVLIAPYWIPIAVSIPLTETLTPLVLLVAVHLPLSSKTTCVCCDCHGYTQLHADSDQATIRASSQIPQPSNTTWNPPHSTITESQTALLASDKQPQNHNGIV